MSAEHCMLIGKTHWAVAPGVRLVAHLEVVHAVHWQEVRVGHLEVVRVAQVPYSQGVAP